MIKFPGGINADVFLSEYWQKKPLLIKQGLPGFRPPLTPDELAGLSLEEEVESRIVLERGFESAWELHPGPFKSGFFAGLPESPWTLLVQGVDLWVPEVEEIINEFPFLPRWRIDDIMVSYANDGGSVGPHFDYYDVFLIQGLGKRRWSIGGLCDETTSLNPDTQLKILQQFDPLQTWLLEPGDILYLPPGISHYGIAEGESMTYSLGFRSPTAGELLDDLATDVISRGGGGFLKDPPLSKEMATERIDPAFIGKVRDLLLDTLEDDQRLGEWFACYMTRCKYPALEDDPNFPKRRAILPGRTGTEDRLFVNGVEITDA